MAEQFIMFRPFSSSLLIPQTPTPIVRDFDFITTVNFTSTGTFTLAAYRGSSTNVAASLHDLIFYRKKGGVSWTPLNSSAQMIVDSTGEWEVGNDWNKSGDNCLTHSFYNIKAINAVTDFWMNENTLGNNAGNDFLFQFLRETSIASLPDGFNLPQGITSVGSYFLYYCFYEIPLTSLPSGFNIPQGITSVGNAFLYNCFLNTPLETLPFGFSLPQGITSVGTVFMNGCFYNTLLNNDGTTEDLIFPNSNYSAPNVFGGTCPITPDSAYGPYPQHIAVNRS